MRNLNTFEYLGSRGVIWPASNNVPRKDMDETMRLALVSCLTLVCVVMSCSGPDPGPKSMPVSVLEDASNDALANAAASSPDVVQTDAARR